VECEEIVYISLIVMLYLTVYQHGDVNKLN
jgi:hypothetical protein